MKKKIKDQQAEILQLKNEISALIDSEPKHNEDDLDLINRQKKEIALLGEEVVFLHTLLCAIHRSSTFSQESTPNSPRKCACQVVDFLESKRALMSDSFNQDIVQNILGSFFSEIKVHQPLSFAPPYPPLAF